MEFLLVVNFCSAFAARAITGDPGQCLRREMQERGSYTSYEACERAGERARRNSRMTYVWVGVFRDRRVEVHRIRDWECQRV